MSDLHRYGFAYGHPRVPIPHGKDEDPARVEFLNHLAALRRQGQRYIPTPKPEQTIASTRNESFYHLPVPRSFVNAAASDVSERNCKMCGKPISAELLRKNWQATTCSPECWKAGRKQHHAKYDAAYRARKRAAQAARKAAGK